MQKDFNLGRYCELISLRQNEYFSVHLHHSDYPNAEIKKERYVRDYILGKA